MDVRVRIGDNRLFTLKQAVLIYQEGSRAFATVHEVKHAPDQAPYLCAGQSVTTGFLETLAKGLGASMAAEVRVFWQERRRSSRGGVGHRRG